MRWTPVIVFLALVVADVTHAGVTVSSERPYRVFAGEERGPHRTGTVEHLLVDETRAETATSDPGDKRHLMIQLWYPADYAGDPAKAAYSLSPQLYSAATRQKWQGALEGVVGSSVLRARVAASDKRLPVLVYNPGLGNPPFTGTAQTEYLASHGYVVVAIGHTGTSGIERFPDGYRYVEDQAPPGFDLTADQERLSPVEQYAQRERNVAANVMPVQIQDIAFVLRSLKRMNDDPRGLFHQRLDLGSVGVFGFSLGGALSFQASRDIPQVKAAANLDGWLYTDVSQTGTDRPLLLIRGLAGNEGVSAEARELHMVGDSRFWRLLSRTRADWCNVEITGTLHRYFSDRMLFDAAETQYLHPRAVHAITNRYLLTFFDHYVKNGGGAHRVSFDVQYPGVSLTCGNGSETAH